MKGPIAHATFRTSVVLGLRLVAQAGTLLLVARLLGPEHFGAFAGIAALAVLLGALSPFGTHLVLLRKMSKSPHGRDAVLPFALGATLLCGNVLLLLYLGVAGFGLRPAEIGIAVVLCIGLAELLLQPLLLLASVEHQAQDHIVRSQLLVNAPLFLRLAVALGVWILQLAHPLEAYAWGYLGTSVLTLILGLRSLETAWPAFERWRLPNSAEWRDASGFAVLNLTALGPSELDKTLALRLLPLAAVGVYVASARVTGAVVLPVIALMIAALPRLFREADQPHGIRLLRWVFAASASYGVVAAIGLWMAAPLVEWLFGAQYQGINEVLRWLSLAVPGMALRFAAGSALMARGRPWLRAGFETLGMSVLVIMALILTPDNPIRGMPLALACSEWTMAIAGWLMIGTTRHHFHSNREIS